MATNELHREGSRWLPSQLFRLNRLKEIFTVDSINLSERVSFVPDGLALKIILLWSLVVLPGRARGDSLEFETPLNAPQKIVIVEVEDVTLVPWGIKLPARIDTGADMSALDARGVSILSNKIADFRLGVRQGGLRLRLPIVEWRQVKTTVGNKTRPVVEIGICLGPKFFRTAAFLTDRSEMSYPFLVGRSVLNGRFVVDTSRANAAPTVCPPGVFLGEEFFSR